MKLRFTITDEGDNTQVIVDPKGWENSGFGFLRDPKLWSLDEVFTSSLFFFGQSRTFALNAEKLYGPDGNLKILIEIDPNDEDEYEFLREGEIPIALFIETLGDEGHLIQFNITQADFWTRFKTRFNSPVDVRSIIDLDGNSVDPTPKFTLPLPGQIIERKYSAKRNRNAVIPLVSQPYLVFGFDTEDLKEIEQESSLTPSEFTALEDVVPQFNLSEDGVLEIGQIKITLSFSDILTDANRPGGILPISFNCATNDKTGDISPYLELYLQKNNDTPIIFTKATRAVAGSFLRNDGVTVNNQGTTVTDYTLSAIQLVCKKHDAIRIYGKLSLSLIRDVYIWGINGWDHDSGSDQTRNGEGTYATVAHPGGPTFAENKGVFEYGGYFDASGNIFPTLINGHSILANNWWNIANDGNLGGTIVSNKNVITAKVNNPTNSIADWDIGVLTIYEGLEAYGNGAIMQAVFQSSMPDTTTEAFLTHDIASGITDRITGQSALFYSEYLGNHHTVREYDEEGCGSNLANAKGLHLRGYKLEGDPDVMKNKPFFSSMQDWFDGIYPIHFLGMGYEKKVIDSVEQNIIRCEPLSYFFPDAEPVVFLSNVFNIKRSYDSDHQFNSAKGGYGKWQSQASTGVGTPSGIDDAQTVSTWNNRFNKIGKQIQFLSKWIAASLTLETTRRVGVFQSANYTYDDETFVIAIVRNETDDGFTPELDENFSSITNLSNSETRYNSRLTPARNFLRGLNYLSSCLQNYLGSVWKFVSGEGNYVMQSTMTTDCPGDDSGEMVAENGDIPVSEIPLFIPMTYEIEHELSYNQFKLFQANKNLPIGISQTEEDYKRFHIKSCERIIGTALFKIIAWPKTLDDAFEITVTESPTGTIPSSRRHESRFDPRYD